MKTYIYWNLHKKVWSIMENGRVIDHLRRAIIGNVEFRVRPAGRARVLKEKKKNVHAFVIGEWFGAYFKNTKLEQVKYNPYKCPSFYSAKNGRSIHRASIVELREDGTCWANGAI